MNPREKLFQEAIHYFLGLPCVRDKSSFLFLEMSSPTLEWLRDCQWGDPYEIVPVEYDGGCRLRLKDGKLAEVNHCLQIKEIGRFDGCPYSVFRIPIIIREEIPTKRSRVKEFYLVGTRDGSFWIAYR
jgi:hypothetical protein